MPSPHTPKNASIRPGLSTSQEIELTPLEENDEGIYGSDDSDFWEEGEEGCESDNEFLAEKEKPRFVPSLLTDSNKKKAKEAPAADKPAETQSAKSGDDDVSIYDSDDSDYWDADEADVQSDGFDNPFAQKKKAGVVPDLSIGWRTA